MSFVKVSTPTKNQIIHGLERTLAVFLVTAATTLDLTQDKTSKAALVAAGVAGFTAVYQFVISSLTDL